MIFADRILFPENTASSIAIVEQFSDKCCSRRKAIWAIWSHDKFQ